MKKIKVMKKKKEEDNSFIKEEKKIENSIDYQIKSDDNKENNNEMKEITEDNVLKEKRKNSLNDENKNGVN